MAQSADKLDYPKEKGKSLRGRRLTRVIIDKLCAAAICHDFLDNFSSNVHKACKYRDMLVGVTQLAFSVQNLALSL